MQTSGVEVAGLPTRVQPFIRDGKKSEARFKFLDEFAVEGGTGWVGQLLSGESRYAGSATLERPYEESGWVHVALKHIASAVRSCPLRFYVEDPKENPQAELIPANHRLNTLFGRPNEIGTFANFIEAGVLNRKLDGEDFWFMFTKTKHPVDVKVDEDGVPRFDYPDFIIPVRGAMVGVDKDRFGFPDKWHFPTKSDPIKFDAGAVVQFKDYDPSNPLRGLGDVQVLMRDLVLEHGAQRYLEAMLRHSGDPGGYILVEEEMSPENERRAEAEAAQKFAPGNAGRWRVISGKSVKYEAAKFGPKDMEYQQLLSHVAQKVASVLGVPLPVMGILDEATFSNYGTAVEQFWRNGNGVLAYLASVEDCINREFLFRLKDERARKYVARFDTTHVEALVDDNAKKLELAKGLAEANIGLSFDEAAKLVGLTGIETEYGDIAWMPTSTTTASEAVAHADTQEEDGRTPEPLSGDVAGSDDVTGEEDDFPGSNDHESGSNGPTGSDGKAPAGTIVQRAEGDPDPDAEERDSYFKAWEAGVLRPGEIRVAKAMSTYLSSYARAQMKAVDEFAKVGEPGVGEAKGAGELLSPAQIVSDEDLLNILLLSHAEWVEKLGTKVKIPLEEVLKAAAEDIAKELGADAWMDGNDPWASDYLRGQRVRLAEGVNSTLAKQVKKALVEVFERQPFDMASLQDHVRRVLPELQKSLRKVFANRTARANAIARTEVNRAAAGTRYETMRREGVKQHQWVTSGDDQVRRKAPHSHRVLDGKIVNIGDTFRDGFTLRHPLDPDGDAADVINCRCVARPVVKD